MIRRRQWGARDFKTFFLFRASLKVPQQGLLGTFLFFIQETCPRCWGCWKCKGCNHTTYRNRPNFCAQPLKTFRRNTENTRDVGNSRQKSQKKAFFFVQKQPSKNTSNPSNTLRIDHRCGIAKNSHFWKFKRFLNVSLHLAPPRPPTGQHRLKQQNTTSICNSYSKVALMMLGTQDHAGF